MELHCPKCNSLSITNLTNKIEDDNDFALLFLKWIIKINNKFIGFALCFMFVLILYAILGEMKIFPILIIIYISCFIINILISFFRNNIKYI